MIYFASDIHLGGGDAAQARRMERAFCSWLDMISADATRLYLLGDIFDFWFEYRKVVPQGFTRVLGRLAAMADRGIEIVFYTGNHDMWCYDYLERECGMRIVRKPSVERIGDMKLHLAHGDNMNIHGEPMLKLMNATFRSSVLRWIFSWIIHPDHFLGFGKWWSSKSRKSHNTEKITVERLGYLVDYAREYHKNNGDVRSYIFGHMHLPHRYTDDHIDVLFLSDWAGSKATYATMDESYNLELKTFDIDETIS